MGICIVIAIQVLRFISFSNQKSPKNHNKSFDAGYLGHLSTQQISSGKFPRICFMF